jgi:hypothetical protein
MAGLVGYREIGLGVNEPVGMRPVVHVHPLRTKSRVNPVKRKPRARGFQVRVIGHRPQ